MRRYDQLPKRARSVFGTKILITKALPKPDDQEFKIRRRKYNKQMDITGKKYNIEAIHICDILPSDTEFFEGPDLSDSGKRKLWMMISEKIKELDVSDSEVVTKRRRERITGELDANPNNLIHLNSRRRFVNRNEFLGIQVDRQNTGQRGQPRNTNSTNWNGQMADMQREHRMRMNGMEQLRRQNLIQEHINRRVRRYGPNGADNWGALMSFINNMERTSSENERDFQNRVNQVFNRRAGRIFQAGDGCHIDLFNMRRGHNHQH